MFQNNAQPVLEHPTGRKLLPSVLEEHCEEGDLVPAARKANCNSVNGARDDDDDNYDTEEEIIKGVVIKERPGYKYSSGSSSGGTEPSRRNTSRKNSYLNLDFDNRFLASQPREMSLSQLSARDFFSVVSTSSMSPWATDAEGYGDGHGDVVNNRGNDVTKVDIDDDIADDDDDESDGGGDSGGIVIERGIRPNDWQENDDKYDYDDDNDDGSDDDSDYDDDDDDEDNHVWSVDFARQHRLASVDSVILDIDGKASSC